MSSRHALLDRAMLAAALVVLTLLSGACSNGGRAGVGPLPAGVSSLGIAANPTDAAGNDSLGSALLTAVATGARMHIYTPLWRDLETSPGVIEVANSRLLLSVYSSIGLMSYVNLRLVDTNSRGTPPDLASTAWDDPAMIARVDAIVDSVATLRREGAMLAFALGNEVDVYFSIHPAEFPAFVALYRRELGRLHALAPDVPVGICTTSPIGNPHLAFTDSLNRWSDVVIHTYYPLRQGTDFLQDEPSRFESDMAAIVARAGGKPVAFQEVGYSSAAINHGTPAKQADFVQRFRRWNRNQPRYRVLFASYFLMTDWSSSTLNYLFGYYGFVSPGFAGYLGGLGLRDTLGGAKPAWTAWREGP